MKIHNLKRFYTVLMSLLVALTIMTPLLIRDGFSIIGEELLESIIITFLLAIGFLANKAFEKELASKEKHLLETWNHLGRFNLLKESFEDLDSYFEKYPESKKEMRELLSIATDKILRAINSPFVMIRIMIPDEVKTLSEYFRSRDEHFHKINISNKGLLEGENVDHWEIMKTSTVNSKIKTFCVFKKSKLTAEQEIIIQKIVNDITALYTIFYFKTCKE